MTKTVTVAATSGFLHQGRIVRPGESLVLSERDAKPLLERGKVEVKAGAAPGHDAPEAEAKKGATKESTRKGKGGDA